MAAISYSIGVSQPLENVTAGTNVPSGGNGTLEIRFDQTATAVTDGSLPAGTRALKKGEVQYMLRILEQYLIRDSNVLE
jgi:hypothetical protein